MHYSFVLLFCFFLIFVLFLFFFGGPHEFTNPRGSLSWRCVNKRLAWKRKMSWLRAASTIDLLQPLEYVPNQVYPFGRWSHNVVSIVFAAC
jgi:hypothetical protein